MFRTTRVVLFPRLLVQGPANLISRIGPPDQARARDDHRKAPYLTRTIKESKIRTKNGWGWYTIQEIMEQAIGQNGWLLLGVTDFYWILVIFGMFARVCDEKATPVPLLHIIRTKPRSSNDGSCSSPIKIATSCHIRSRGADHISSNDSFRGFLGVLRLGMQLPATIPHLPPAFFVLSHPVKQASFVLSDPTSAATCRHLPVHVPKAPIEEPSESKAKVPLPSPSRYARD
ncbi:hypothetical protein M501DRAFT_1048409 [Patellaria atrata CBS 101060]|uniref:Uncharacterized protein n=1 Tax=Patellaria atrata CBS 101060 TaxID=1346257 RepID=A0A9P4SFT6_9PEZI|nr:hypothetical protein M501DRAFT_1048409 [Patellaria atrata CBS 101060]